MDQDLQKLNAQQVNAVLRKYLKPKEMVVAIAADHERQKQGAAAPAPETAEQAPVTAPAPEPLDAQP
jgi:zinc protease